MAEKQQRTLVDQVFKKIFDLLVRGEIPLGGVVNEAALAERFQVLVVTHSPQVAARGTNHWRITKEGGKKSSLTQVANLGEDDRIEEIARMLAGEEITPEARAAAAALMEG